ncbi:O-methyltransferase [Mycena olivaceomarginata]|nr:O-methyltransferase [Mycena olivaceomarginata]
MCDLRLRGNSLNLLASSIGAKKILEVGTLGGYSTIWLARALPADGEAYHTRIYAKVAEENIDRAGLSNQVKIIVGLVHESMLKMHPNTPFDLIFIDADKPGNLNYFPEAKRLSVLLHFSNLIVDNVVRYGRVADPEYTDANVEGVRTLLKAEKGDKDVEATTISTVRDKGYNGFMYAIRK